MFDNICSSWVSVAPWKHSLTARLHSAHSMMGGVISLCSKENIIVQKESAWGPEKHSGLLIQAAWSKENNTQLCYSSGLFFFSSLVWTAGVLLCVLRYLILTVHPLLCRKPSSFAHVFCVQECMVKFSWENRRWRVHLIETNSGVTLLLSRKTQI